MADEDRPGEYQEHESAEAHADAAEALRRELSKPEVRQAADAIARGTAKDEPEHDEEAGQEAAAEEKPAEATDEGEDYDPEEAAEYPEDEQEEAKAPKTEEVKEPEKAEAAPPPETSRSTPPEWSDEDREAWEDFKQRRKAPEEQETPEAAAKLREDTLKEILRRDPQMDQAFSALNARREQITEADNQEKEAVKEIRALDAQIRDAQAVVKYHQTLAEKDPDDELVRSTLGSLRSDLLALQNDRNAKAIDFQELHIRNNDWKIEYQQGLNQFKDIVQGEIDSRAQRLQSERDGQKWGQEAVKEFDEHLPGLMKEAGIPEELKPRVSKFLRAFARPGVTDPEELMPDRLRGWMKKTIDEEIKPMVRGVQDVKARDYAEKKARDAEQPAPPSDRSTAPPRKPRALMDSREADRLADAAIRKELRAQGIR